MQFLGIKKWCSANIFPDTKQKHVCWKLCIVRKIFCCVSYILFSLPNEVSVNPVIFVPFFCWLWVFLLENLKSKKLWWCPLERLGKYKKVYTRNNIFKKRISNMRFWIIYILVQISFFFLGLLLGVLAGPFFCFSWLTNHGGLHFYLASLAIKKLPTALSQAITWNRGMLVRSQFWRKINIEVSKWPVLHKMRSLGHYIITFFLQQYDSLNDTHIKWTLTTN